MKIVYLMLIILAANRLGAVSSRTATYDSKADFERGELSNTAVTHDGLLMPAPSNVDLWESDELVIWTMVGDSKGRLYLSVGNQGRVFRRDAQSKVELFFDAEEPMVFALAVDHNDHLYAAASPGGKIYKISPTGQAMLFFDPKADYTWDLKFDGRGNLLAATGKPARIFQIDARGQATTIFQGEEQHVRSLTLGADRLYFGTSGKGYVYQLKTGEAPFVLFDPKMEEVQQIVDLGDGFLYALVTGRVTPAVPQERRQQEPEESEASEEDEDSLAAQIMQVAAAAAPSSSLFRISKEGHGRDLWTGMEDRVQSIAPFQNNSLLVGSGRSGKIYTLTPRGEVSLLGKIPETQIMSFLALGQKTLFATANAAKLYEMTSQRGDSAYYVSEVIDAGLTAAFGKLTREGQAIKDVSFFTRSGNTEQPSPTWSDWKPVRAGGEELAIDSPPARFLQWKCEFKDQRAVIDRVTVSYAQTNIAPEITFINVNAPNEVYEAEGGARADGIVFPAPLGNRQVRRGFRCVDWAFEDANTDRLHFHLHYRRLNDANWRVLAKKLTSNVYSWDAAQMADGWYEIKVTVSDSLANPPGQALTGEMVSRPFLVDNTGPEIIDVKIAAVGEKKVLTFQVKDAWRIIERVQVSVDAGAWQSLAPDDAVMDSKTERFTFALPGVADYEVAIKAEDKNSNITVIHTK